MKKTHTAVLRNHKKGLRKFLLALLLRILFQVAVDKKLLFVPCGIFSIWIRLLCKNINT